MTLTGTNLADTTAVTFGTGRNGTGLACTATSCTVSRGSVAKANARASLPSAMDGLVNGLQILPVSL